MRRRQVTIEKHSSKTKHVIDSPFGPVFVDIENSTTIVVAVEDEEELFEPCTLEEGPLIPSPRRIPRLFR
jgi:hypothetical protein